MTEEQIRQEWAKFKVCLADPSLDKATFISLCLDLSSELDAMSDAAEEQVSRGEIEDEEEDN